MTDRIHTACAQLQTLVRALADDHPRLGLSFGYIGNLTHNDDDRAWSVFTTLSTRRGANACNVRWGSVPTSELPKLASKAETDLADWCARTEGRLDAGELFRVAEDRPRR